MTVESSNSPRAASVDTQEGDLSAGGDVALGGILTNVTSPVGSLGFSIRTDDCWERLGLGTTFDWIAGP